MKSQEINELPVRARQYIHDLETNADPAGTIQENALLKDQTRELDAKIAGLKARIAELEIASRKVVGVLFADDFQEADTEGAIRELYELVGDGE